MNASDPCEVIVTAPDLDWLKAMCHELVESRLASSAHVISAVTSIYRWNDEVHEAIEARAFLRTRFALVGELTEVIVARHPYEVPNVTAVPIVGGNPSYLDWIAIETRGA